MRPTRGDSLPSENRLLTFGSQKRLHSGAFSLVEVVMSLGIVSFAMVGIMSLLPMGLATFRDSINTTTQAQIVQRLLNDALLADYTSLKNYTTNYDESGRGVLSSSSSRIYTVDVVLTNITSTVTTNFPPSVATNLLIIVRNKTQPTQTNYYSSIVVKND